MGCETAVSTQMNKTSFFKLFTIQEMKKGLLKYHVINHVLYPDIFVGYMKNCQLDYDSFTCS